MIEYKGYIGQVEIDPEANVLSGRVIGTRDVITFEGATPQEVVQAFKDSVDDYLEFCKSRGEKPDKSFSGKFVVRTEPQTHRLISLLAEARGESLNSFINQRLTQGGSALESFSSPGSGKSARPKKPPSAKAGVGARNNPDPPRASKA